MNMLFNKSSEAVIFQSKDPQTMRENISKWSGMSLVGAVLDAFLLFLLRVWIIDKAGSMERFFDYWDAEERGALGVWWGVCVAIIVVEIIGFVAAIPAGKYLETMYRVTIFAKHIEVKSYSDMLVYSFDFKDISSVVAGGMSVSIFANQQNNQVKPVWTLFGQGTQLTTMFMSAKQAYTLNETK